MRKLFEKISACCSSWWKKYICGEILAPEKCLDCHRTDCSGCNIKIK